MLRYTVDLTGEDSLLKGYDVTLSLGDLLYGDSVALEGSWGLSFTLEPAEQEVLTLAVGVRIGDEVLPLR